MSGPDITRRPSKSTHEADAGPGGGAPPEPLHELTLGRPAVRPPALDLPAGVADGSGLDALAAACRRKAEAARGVALRLRRRDAPAVRPGDPETAAWADRVTDAVFFLPSTGTGGPADVAPVDALAGSFEALAAAVELLDEAARGERRGRLDQLLPFMAEAQSAVRVAARALSLSEEPEQARAYDWLKATAARRRVYLHRYMRVDDPADPARSSALLAEIHAGSATIRDRAPKPVPGIDRARAVADRLRTGQGTDADWRALGELVDRAVAEGTPPSHRDIRDLLIPLEDLPDRDDLPPGYRLALREVDRYLATRPSSTSHGDRAPTAEMTEARRLLAGTSAVLIGGARRRDAQRELIEALGLTDLTWVETKEHQSVLTFAPAVSRPEVAVVLLAIRWSSHGFGDVKQFCDRHGKPLVRLPGGYGPNQVAAQVVAQCGDRLAGA